MEETDSKRLGYRQPPAEHRFKKGKFGNHRGRPKKVKPPVQTNDRDILKCLDAETLESNGVEMSKREIELRILQAKALKGDLRAMKMLDQKRSALKLDQPVPRGGVLVVPQAPSREEWEKRVYANQAKYRSASSEPATVLDKNEGES